MIFLILPLVFIIGIIIYDLKRYGFLDVETFGKCLGFIVLALILSFFIWGVVSSTAEVEEAYTEEYKLCDMNNGIYLTAHEEKYGTKITYFYEEPNRGIKSKSISANCCYINYTTDKPKIIWYHYDYKSKFLR